MDVIRSADPLDLNSHVVSTKVVLVSSGGIGVGCSESLGKTGEPAYCSFELNCLRLGPVTHAWSFQNG
jgi:hypothetical protein